MRRKKELEDLVKEGNIEEAKKVYNELLYGLKRDIEEIRKSPLRKKRDGVMIIDNSRVPKLLKNFYEKYYNIVKEAKEMKEEKENFEKILIEEIRKEGLEASINLAERCEGKIRKKIVLNAITDLREGLKEFDRFYKYYIMERVVREIYEKFRYREVKKLVEEIRESAVRYLQEKELESEEGKTAFGDVIKLKNYREEIEKFLERVEKEGEEEMKKKGMEVSKRLRLHLPNRGKIKKETGNYKRYV